MLPGVGKEASPGVGGVPPAPKKQVHKPVNMGFRGPDGSEVPTGDNTQAQVAKQKGHKPKKTGKEAVDDEQAPAVDNDEVPAPPKVGWKGRLGKDGLPNPEQYAPLVLLNPAVVAVTPHMDGYPG